MSVTERLKSIDWLRRPIKKAKIWKEYFLDAKSFSKFYMEEADRRNQVEYRMLMFVHNLEKGMCMPNPRPFGVEKVKKLMSMIEVCEANKQMANTSSYKMALSILYQWCVFFMNNHWNEPLVDETLSFINKRDIEVFKNCTGYEVLSHNDMLVNKDSTFDAVVSSRKSVRTFSSTPLNKYDVLECIKLSQKAPTACNRQMIKIIQVSNRELCDVISNTIYGASGITTDSVQYFVVTFDIRSLDYYGERNQGYLNAGLVAMNFANALHSRGIGSCFLQWANTAKEDKLVRNKLGINEYEKIAVVLAAGYYADRMCIAKSYRRNIDEVFSEIR